MAQSNEIAKTQVITKDGVMTATVVDRVSPDRISLMLTRGSAAALYARTTDNADVVDRSLKDLVVFPLVEL